MWKRRLPVGYRRTRIEPMLTALIQTACETSWQKPLNNFSCTYSYLSIMTMAQSNTNANKHEKAQISRTVQDMFEEDKFCFG